MNSYLRVLRHKDFRYLFLGQAASVIGDRVVLVAIALYVTRLTGSATDLGLVLGAQIFVFVVLLLFGGVWADRLPRQRIMIATDLARAVLHILLAVLILSATVRIWELVVIEALYGGAAAFFQPAYSGLIPQTVPEELVQDAKALTETVTNFAFFVGPALATALVLGVGGGIAFMFDAATFLFSAALLLCVHPRARGAAVSVRGSVWFELRGGWLEVRSRQWVWVTIAAFTGIVLFLYAPFLDLAPLIARDHYGGVGAFGVMESLSGLGAVVGALLTLRWRPEHPLVSGFLVLLSWPLLNGALALDVPLALVYGVSIVNGFALSVFIVWWETALARNIPAQALSRVSSYDLMGSLALMPLGLLIAGPLAKLLGAQTVLGIGSVAGLAMVLLALSSRKTRALRG